MSALESLVNAALRLALVFFAASNVDSGEYGDATAIALLIVILTGWDIARAIEAKP